MENPFDILGITVTDARIIRQLDPKRRQSCLNLLRKYFSSYLHPDIKGVSHIALTRVNMALGAINTDIGFNRALVGYIKFGPRKGAVSSSHADVLREQLKSEKNRHDNVVKELKRELANKDRIIKNLELSITKLNRLIFRAEQETKAKFRSTIRELRKNLHKLGMAKRQSESKLSAYIFKLIEVINNNMTEYEIPEGALPIRDLAGMTIKQTRGVLKVDKNLSVTRRMKATTGIVYRTISLGTLISGISPEIIGKEGKLGLSSSDFNDCLSNLKLYIQEGMRPVSTKWGNLYVYGPIKKVVKTDE